MKAVVFKGIGKDLQVEDLPMPKAGPGELVFKVEACGICGSDLHGAEAPGFLQPDQVIGHEYAGTVVEIGPGVGPEWQIGDRLIAIPAKPCGACPACQGGKYDKCDSLILQGYDPRMPGAYAEYSACLAPLAMKLPKDFDARDAALIEPLCVGLNAYRAAQAAPGATVMIVGAGVIGLAVAIAARFFGAGNVVIAEMVPSRMERAKQIGADLVIDAAQCANPVAECQKLTGQAPSVIFECVGRPMIQKLIDMAPMGAHLVMVGTGMQPEQMTVLPAAMKRLRMTFTLGYEPADFGFMLRMLANGRISAKHLVTGTVSLDQLPEMFAKLQKPNDHCKVMIVP